MSKKIKVIVCHEYAGCDTGCCGHAIEVDGERIGYDFSHPYNEDPRQFAMKLAQDAVSDEYGPDHIADLDWENCIISDD